MAGILDSKSRIMDVVITEQGRRQLASGRMRIEYATFTDIGSFYEDDGTGVLENPANRIYFEAASDLPSDLVTLETDDSNILVPYRADSFGISGKNMVVSGSSFDKFNVTGSAEVVSNAIFQSWQNLQVIGTDDPLDDQQGFTLSRNKVQFQITENFPFTRNDVSTATIDDVESLSHDIRLSKLQNFKYLPPVNNAGVLAGRPIGQFPNFNENSDENQQILERRLQKLEFTDVEFVDTSIENNFVMQVFELSGDEGVIKLDVIDYGFKPASSDPTRLVRTLFAGKILNDGFGNPTFINIFTLEIS
jgi:hypothetical protein